jgi:hypothetical protein
MADVIMNSELIRYQNQQAISWHGQARHKKAPAVP